jgi:hypothetical protein
MSNTHSVTTCRWARPTLFLHAPYWFEAETYPWTCTCDASLRVLRTTARCPSCLRWEAPPAEAPAQTRSVNLAPIVDPLWKD